MKENKPKTTWSLIVLKTFMYYSYLLLEATEHFYLLVFFNVSIELSNDPDVFSMSYLNELFE